MAFPESIVAVPAFSTRTTSSMGRRAGVVLGLLSMLVAVPAWAGPAPQRNILPSTTTSAPAPKPLSVSLPGLGGRKLQLQYSGPVAPWKVLNPLHQGERQGRIAVSGPSTANGQSVHSLAVTTVREPGVRRGGMTFTSSHTGEASSQSKSFDVGTSIERKGLSTEASQHATYDAEQTHADGTASHLKVTGRMTTSQADHAPATSTRELRAESFARRPASGGFEHEKRSGSLQSVKTGDQTKHEASAHRDLVGPDGRFQEHGLAVRVGEAPAAGQQRTVIAKVGQVTGRDGVADKGDGVVIKRNANGDFSSKLVAGGENRTRSVTVGDQTQRQGMFARFKSGVVGEKQSAEGSFDKGVPTGE